MTWIHPYRAQDLRADEFNVMRHMWGWILISPESALQRAWQASVGWKQVELLTVCMELLCVHSVLICIQSVSQEHRRDTDRCCTQTSFIHAHMLTAARQQCEFVCEKQTDKWPRSVPTCLTEFMEAGCLRPHRSALRKTCTKMLCPKAISLLIKSECFHPQEFSDEDAEEDIDALMSAHSKPASRRLSNAVSTVTPVYFSSHIHNYQE